MLVLAPHIIKNATMMRAAEGKFARIALAGLTIVCSSLFVNVSFALHYAHEFYGEGSDDEVGGLRFPSRL
jgi:uncharacterized membrane protein